jgi:hypothetical protein
MTDQKTCLKALDSLYWQLLRETADAYADTEPDTAAGFLWLAERKKFPAGDRSRWFWMYPRTELTYRGQGSPPSPEEIDSASARLPVEVKRLTNEMFPMVGCQPGEFVEASVAFLAAARAVGRWLREKAVISEEVKDETV